MSDICPRSKRLRPPNFDPSQNVTLYLESTSPRSESSNINFKNKNV